MCFHFKGKQQQKTAILKVIFSLNDLDTNQTLLWWSAWEVMIPDDWFTFVLFSSNVRRFGLRHKSQKIAGSTTPGPGIFVVVVIIIFFCFYLFFIFLNKICFFQFVSFPLPHIDIDCFSLFFLILGACASFSACDSADGGANSDEVEDDTAADSLMDWWRWCSLCVCCVHKPRFP